MAGLTRTASRAVRQLARSIRRRMPDSLIQLLSAALVHWGKATAPLRVNPLFIVAGAQRCGTTTLYRLLEQHPNLVRPTASKGIGYFDDSYCEGFRWYRAHFPLRLTARLIVPRSEPYYTFESSGYYLVHPLAARRIAHDLPYVKVVVVVRNPVDRAHSAHAHEVARGFDTLGFEEAIRSEPERTRGERERLIADTSYASYAHRHYAYLERGRYAEQISEMRRWLGTDKVYVMEADRFFLDPVAEFRALQDWLGLPLWDPPTVERSNERAREPMPDKLRAELLDYFEPFDADLAEILGRPPSWR